MVELIIMQSQNLLSPESISIFSVLVFFLIWFLNERKEAKKEWKDLLDDVRRDHEREVESLNNRSDELLSEIAKLQEDKYKVTREVIPLLIKLIDKLNEDE